VNNVGAMLYQTIVRYAEGGERVTRVVLPESLFADFAQDGQTIRLMRTLGVSVTKGDVREPDFQMGVSK